MKAQVPAEGILKTHDWGDSKWYHVACSCGNDDDSIELSVEADEHSITVTHYTKQKTNFWSEPIPQKYWNDDPWYQEFNHTTTNIVNGFIRRCKLTWEIWFNGYVSYQTSTIMSKQQALNYAETLKSAIKDVEQFEKERQAKADLQNKIASRLAKETDCV
jgi:hypothetical protein